MKNISNKKIKFFSFTVKLIVAIVAYGFLVWKFQNYKIDYFFVEDYNSRYKILLFSTVILLMPVNWFLETLKWQFLVKGIQQISFLKSFKAVLTGITFAIITPNRIGELAGRVVELKSENRVKGVFATFVGSFSQVFVTLFAGFVASVLFSISKYADYISGKVLYILMFSSGVAFTIAGVLIFNLSFFVKFTNKFKFFSRLKHHTEALKNYSVKDIIKVFGFSFLRYIVFAFQFFVLLLYFDTKITIQNVFIGIALMYFVSSVIPSFALSEIGIRTSNAIFFLGLFISNTTGIFMSSITLWIINLALPASVGSLIFFRAKLFKNHDK